MEQVPHSDELDTVLRAGTLAATLGIRLEDWGAGWARTSLRPGPELGNLVGTVHGGVLVALADAAFEAACNSYGRLCVAQQVTAHFSAPARCGDALVADARELTRSRRAASYDLRVTSGDTVCAVLLAVAFRTDRWHLSEEHWPQEWRRTH